MDWSPQQAKALDAVASWFRDPSKKQVFRVFGYAGTGKTTLARYFAREVGNVSFAAYTGKAAHVLEQKGCFGAKTIHSLIYKIDDDRDPTNPTFVLNPNSEIRWSDLIIIDEVSMVDEEMANDLLSFGKPVLVLGDPEQLPPIKGTGYFTDCEPDVLLTEIHRQARDNPIIDLATRVREKQRLKVGKYGDSEVITKLHFDHIQSADQILVGRNITRRRFNYHVRRHLGRESTFPLADERLICLKNDRQRGLLNGQIWYTRSDSEEYQFSIAMELVSDDDSSRFNYVQAHKSYFETGEMPDPRTFNWHTHFDYAYAITVHKAQGSQWNSVIIQDESDCFRKDKYRWLYTAITRAAEKVTVVI